MKARVYFSREITPEKVVELYRLLDADLPGKVMNESDAPVVVSSDITGPAMGLGSVEVLGVYVRENPTKDSEILTMAGQNDSVLVLSKEGDWYRVSCNGVTGFVSKEYMTVADSGDADLGYGLVLAGANIRTEPNEESETLESVGEDGPRLFVIVDHQCVNLCVPIQTYHLVHDPIVHEVFRRILLDFRADMQHTRCGSGHTLQMLCVWPYQYA